MGVYWTYEQIGGYNSPKSLVCTGSSSSEETASYHWILGGWHKAGLEIFANLKEEKV